jgi:hypothetical protein
MAGPVEIATAARRMRGAERSSASCTAHAVGSTRAAVPDEELMPM